jgi:hypothetical protein
MAALLGVEPAEVADRCGISTPVPSNGMTVADQLAALNRRVERLETALAALIERLPPEFRR